MSTYFRTFLTKLHQNLNILREHEAKFGGNAPLELLNQISDHESAIALTEQVIAGELSETEWHDALQPLLLAIEARVDEADSSVSIGDIGGGIENSVIAGRDINQIIVNVVGVLDQSATNKSESVSPIIRALSELVFKQVGKIDPRTAQRYLQNQAGYDAPLRDTLTELLEADRGLVARFNALLDRYEALSRDQISIAGSGALALGNKAKAAGERGVVAGQIGRDIITGDSNVSAGGHIIVAEKGATVVVGELPVTMTAVDRQSVLGRYLHHVISRNRYLQLQGIRSGGKLVHIELDQIYVSLQATRQQVIRIQEAWLDEEAALLPGESQHVPLQKIGTKTETITISVNEALGTYSRLVVLGDPGSGKTTLLRYLALNYARDLAEGTTLVQTQFALDENGWLPILLPLRQIGVFLRTRPDDGTEGHILLLEFLLRSLKNERIELPNDFFDTWLTEGRAIILLDGLDEVADPVVRRRVSNLIEAFTWAYPNCRYLVTSREVGYAGSNRLGEGFEVTTVRDFTLADVKRFLTSWHRLIAISQMGPGESAEAYAADQTEQLLRAIELNERIRELAINPLLLTVIAMVHRDRVKLPDRRAELYTEAVDVLLGKWDEARGVAEISILAGKPFDTGDKRLMLQNLALYMHEQQQKEIAVETLKHWLSERFNEIVKDQREAARSANRFLTVIEERTGLLVARGDGLYSFSHLTFQEYLAALAVAERDDYIAYTLKHVSDPWWRQVILLEAGYLSTQGKRRVTTLIQTIMDCGEEPEPYHNLVLATEALRDIGGARVEGDLEDEIRRRIRKDIDHGYSFILAKFLGRLRETPTFSRIYVRFRPYISDELPKRIVQTVGTAGSRRHAAVRALAMIGKVYWTGPYGEPEWVEIPSGEFWMGTNKKEEIEKPLHRPYLERFLISRTPITNMQYGLFIEATGYKRPNHWTDERPPRNLERYPVTDVSFEDALAYCQWLSRELNTSITLPSEAQWEKAARGHLDSRRYPWGDEWDPTRCNTLEIGLGNTSPVGVFPEGASPYGCLDMAGNVWEWTTSIWGKQGSQPDFYYPYDATDGRENLMSVSDAYRVVRGGSFRHYKFVARCAFRGNGQRPTPSLGFRVISPG